MPRSIEVTVHYDGAVPNSAEVSRREGDDRYRALIDHAPVAIFVNRGGKVTFANAATVQLFGAETSEQLIGRDALGLFHEGSRPLIKSRIQRMRECGEPASLIEEKIVRLDGTLVDVEVAATRFMDCGEEAIHVVVHDITERKRADSALRAVEARFLRVFQSSPVMLALSSVEDGTLLDVNEAFLRVSSYAREEVIGRTSISIGWVPPDVRQRLLARLLQGEHLCDIPLTLRTKEARPIEALYSGELVDLDGTRRILSAWQDITQQKRSEALLRLQGSALAAAANAILITSPQGEIEWANEAFTHFTGYALVEAIGRKPGALLKSGRQNQAFYDELWTTIGAGRVWRGEIVNRRKDGHLYIANMTITPVKDEAGANIHFVAVKQDITRERELEGQFRQAQKMDAVGQLAAGIAHDFNNILAAELMQLGLLQLDPSVGKNVRDSLGQVEKLVMRAAGLTRQLLTFSRQQTPQLRSVNLAETLAGLSDMLCRLLGETISIKLCAPAGPVPAIQADPGLIEQVVVNLCVNARDAMSQGGELTLKTTAETVSLEKAARHGGVGGVFVRLDITDTGCGMDARTAERAFEPFFTTKTVGKGTGLGLAVVYGIVKQHRGWVEIDSRVGQGSTFSVYLPAANPAPEIQPQAPKRTAELSGGSETVLLVEDEEAVRVTVSLALRHYGYRVVEAVDGPDAMTKWQDFGGKFDLLLTDMAMPGGMNGLKVAERLRSQKPELKVILCTGYSDDLQRERGDGIPVLRKPFGHAVLLAEVRRALDAQT